MGQPVRGSLVTSIEEQAELSGGMVVREWKQGGAQSGNGQHREEMPQFMGHILKGQVKWSKWLLEARLPLKGQYIACLRVVLFASCL